nr:PadR family transcriptional regulator [Coralloluteibacterium stylophorae]
MSGPGDDQARPSRTRTRSLGHGDLRLLLLALIAQQPRHGYELIRLVADMFHGRYAPSPGVVYPALAQLESAGLVTVEAEGGRRRHAVSAAGRAWLAAHRDEVDAVLARTARSARAAARAGVPMPVRRAMETLKRALVSREGHWTPDEAARVEALLREAAGAIERGM